MVDLDREIMYILSENVHHIFFVWSENVFVYFSLFLKRFCKNFSLSRSQIFVYIKTSYKKAFTFFNKTKTFSQTILYIFFVPKTF